MRKTDSCYQVLKKFEKNEYLMRGEQEPTNATDTFNRKDEQQ